MLFQRLDAQRIIRTIKICTGRLNSLPSSYGTENPGNPAGLIEEIFTKALQRVGMDQGISGCIKETISITRRKYGIYEGVQTRPHGLHHQTGFATEAEKNSTEFSGGPALYRRQHQCIVNINF